MYLLREYYEVDMDRSNKYLLESKIQDNNLYLVGIIQAANKKNGNGRIYPMPLLEREMRLYEKLIKDGRATGELDHPDTEEVKLANISHIVEKYWWDGDHVMGKIRVLPTPNGEILRTIIEGKVKVGISSRALGEVRETDDGLIVEELNLICFDIVQNPSTMNAFMLRESQKMISDISSKSDTINRKIFKILSM